MQMTTNEFEVMGESIKFEDERMQEKFDFMYNYMDYDHDRAVVRNKYLKEMNKKTSLEDIGEILDDMVIDSKAANFKYYNLRDHHNATAERAKKDYTSEDFKWSGRLLGLIDPKKPIVIDDPSLIHEAGAIIRPKIEKVYEEVMFNDSQRDYSEDSLTQDEKFEISLFHSMKQDPYYKHYLYNHLREYAEEEDEINLSFPFSSLEKDDIYDHVKFDRLNLYDFRRNIPMKERESKIDSKGRTYGFGKRKRSRAIAQVQPGTGRVFVNGKPLLQSLFMPMQRQRIMLPLSVTGYTCLLDMNIKVWGGGFNG